MLQSAASRVAQVAREDLVMFINACLACTGQREFYDDAYGKGFRLISFMTIFWETIGCSMRDRSVQA
jgi:hypothetical protein